jgi:hypothetical protein
MVLSGGTAKTLENGWLKYLKSRGEEALRRPVLWPLYSSLIKGAGHRFEYARQLSENPWFAGESEKGKKGVTLSQYPFDTTRVCTSKATSSTCGFSARGEATNMNAA